MPVLISSHREYVQTHHMPALDGLRGIAVLMVLIYHCPRSAAPGIEMFQAAGDAGVDMFFVVSGFLITMLLLRDRCDDRMSQRQLLGSFFLKRVLRIFPLYYLAIALYWFKTQISADPMSAEVYVNALPFLATYTIDTSLGWTNVPFPDFGIAWSLAVEEKFYLFWPFVVVLLKPRQLAYAGFTIIGATLLWRTWLIQTYAGELTARLYYPFDLRMDGIMWGCVLACLLHERKSFESMTRVLRTAPLFPAAAALFVAVAIMAANDSFWRYLLLPLSATIIVGIAVIDTGRLVVRPLRARPIRAVGRVCYGMYVFHPLAIGVVRASVGEHSLSQQMFCIVGASLLSFVLASVSYRWFESPIMKMRSYLTFQQRPSAVPAA